MKQTLIALDVFIENEIEKNLTISLWRSVSGFFKATVNASMYETKLNNSYRCNSEDVIALTADADSKAFVHLSNLQMEAFRTQTDDKFSSGNFS